MLMNGGKEVINLELVANVELKACPVKEVLLEDPKRQPGEVPDPGVDLVVWYLGGRAKTYHYATAEDGQVALNQFNRCMDAKIEAAQTIMGTLATAKALGPALRMIGILS